MKVDIIPAKIEHIPGIALNIREADKQELFDYALMNPFEALNISLANSKVAWTGFIDGEPICMFGVARGDTLSTTGYIWLIGTKELDAYAKVFLRKSSKLLKEMFTYYDRLENYVSVENVRSLEWLSWLGFKFGDPQPMGPMGKLFINIYKEKYATD
jgi:hypothetical protein